jgi:hypothetical protein
MVALNMVVLFILLSYIQYRHKSSLFRMTFDPLSTPTRKVRSVKTWITPEIARGPETHSRVKHHNEPEEGTHFRYKSIDDGASR